MAIILLNFSSYYDKKTQRSYQKSLVSCDICLAQRIVDKSSLKRSLDGNICFKCRCQNHTDRLSDIYYHNLAKKQNIRVLQVGKHVRDISIWRCNHGHIWNNSYFTQERRKNPCNICANIVKLVEKDYINLANQKQIEYLGPFPSNSMTPTNWRCKCGETFCRSYGKVRMSNTCSCYDCKGDLISGNKHYLYNPNLTEDDRKKTRYSREYIFWAKQIYKMFNYTCQKCSIKGSQDNPLHAHHIYNWSEFVDLRFDINNGICLCK